MGRSTFSGPIVVGERTHVTANRTFVNASGVIQHFNSVEGVVDRPATVPVTQIATVRGNSSGGTNIFLPAGCDVMAIGMQVVCAASAATSIAGQGINFRIGRVAGNDAFFGTIKVSAVRPYQMGVDALNLTNASTFSWFGVSAETQVFIDATAATSAESMAELGGRVYITYVPR